MKNPNNQSTKNNPVGRFMVAVGAVIELRSTGKILLKQRSNKLDWHPGEWEILYGRLDQFEDPKTALHREAEEETGLTDLKIIGLLSVWHIYRGQKRAENELVGITFHCKTNTHKIKLSAEHSGYKWVLPEKALKMVKVDGIKQDIKRFIE